MSYLDGRSCHDIKRHSLWGSEQRLPNPLRAVIGALGAGLIADRVGRKPLFMASLAISFAAITMELVATTPALFFGGKFLNGFSIGALQSVTISYIGEVSRSSLYGTSYCMGKSGSAYLTS